MEARDYLRLTNEYEDAALRRGVGSVINHKPRAQANCEFFVSGDHIELRAVKDIRNGQELYVSYGRDFYLHEPGVAYLTDTRKTGLDHRG